MRRRRVAVEILFDLGGVPTVFERNKWTGRAQITRKEGSVPLVSPFRFSTHFRLPTRTTWKVQIDGRTVEVVNLRPRFFGGMRRNTFTISVDGVVAAEKFQ
jgi:hypothetical protein